MNQNQSGVIIQSFDTNGNVQLTPTGATLRPVSSAYDDPSDFSITSDGIIAFYIIGNPPNQTISAIKSDFSGNLQWNGFPVNICTKNSGKDDLSVGLFVNNQVIAAWTDSRNDYGIYAQNITNDGQSGPLSAIENFSAAHTFINLYPNPFEENLSLYFSNPPNGKLTLKLFDVAGRQVWHSENPEVYNNLYPIHIPCLDAGVYFMEVDLANIKKLIKISKL
ncbi:MAG: T9SS type A sorting domain-containing protein [Bacteroidetes bacterium]|nr:T9SS type A sorting domain-containing protein [Bacteroidota bacterium]